MNARLAFGWMRRLVVAMFVDENPTFGRADADAWLAGQPLPSVIAAQAEAVRKRSPEHVAEVEARLAAAR